MKKFLVISKGLVHPSLLCRKKLFDILSETEERKFEFSRNLSELESLETKGYDGVVLFLHEKEIEEKSLLTLIGFVERGGGLFCIHGALASFKTYVDYTDLTGAEFTGHDKIGPIHIEGGREYTITDELYGFRLRDDCEVIQYGNGKPVYWSRKYKKGTVMGLAPGHRSRTFDNPGFVETIRDGIRRLEAGGFK